MHKLRSNCTDTKTMSKKNKFPFENLELKPFPVMEKPNKDNTLIDLTLFDKLTFTPIKKIRKRPTGKALKELEEVLDHKG